jgi:threonine/homoserine/homoserine lactone efflux protein
LKLAGAAYLVLLGLQTLRDAWRGRRHAARTRDVDSSRAFRQGLLSNLGNPKMAVFFTSLLPQFGGRSFPALLALGVVFCSMTFAWLSAYAAGDRARSVLERARVRRVLDVLTGAVLVALGLKLAAERR